MATVFPDYDGSEFETNVGPGMCEGSPASRVTPEEPIPCGSNGNIMPSRGLSAVGSTGTGMVAALVSSPSSPVEVETTGVATDVHGEQQHYPGTHPLEDLGQDALETVLTIESGLQGTLDAVEQLDPIVSTKTMNTSSL